MTEYELTQVSTGEGGGIMPSGLKFIDHFLLALFFFIFCAIVIFGTAYNRTVYLMYAPPTPMPAATVEALKVECEAWNNLTISSEYVWDENQQTCRESMRKSCEDKNRQSVTFFWDEKEQLCRVVIEERLVEIGE